MSESNLVAQQADALAKALNMEASNGLTQALRDTAFGYQVTDSQMFALLVVANQYKLNPWTKEIYAMPAKKGNGIIPIVGVDGWSRIINEHPGFDGMTFEDVGEIKNLDGAKPCPSGIRCSIYRKDRSHPISVTEYLDETYRPPVMTKTGKVPGPWQTHTKRMLRHKAMIQCARLAFGYTGFYDPDEGKQMQEAQERDMDNAYVVPESQPVQQTPSAAPAQPVQKATKADEMKGRMNIDAPIKDLTQEILSGIATARSVEELKLVGQRVNSLSDDEKAKIRPVYMEKLSSLKSGQKPDFNQIKSSIENAQNDEDLKRAFDMIKHVPQEQQSQLCELYESKRKSIGNPA